MKNIRSVFAPLLLLTLGTAGLAQTNQLPARITSCQVVDYWVTLEEQRLVAVADAMPADKYPFAPSSGEFKSVRTFAEQLKHTAADNYMLGAAILGEKPPADVGDETGPASLRTKADVIQYLKDSFAFLHKSVIKIDDMNVVIETPPISPMPKGRATRLGLAIEVLMHTFDHYGQLVEYLRMNGIVPPASRLDVGGNTESGGDTYDVNCPLACDSMAARRERCGTLRCRYLPKQFAETRGGNLLL